MYHSYVNVYREPPVLLIPTLERWGQWPKQMTATKEAWASRLQTDLRILRGVPQPELEHLLNHVESIECAQQDGNYILFWAQPVFGFVWAPPPKKKKLKHIPDGFPKWCGWTTGKMINSSTKHIQAHVQMILPIESYWILSFPMAIFQFFHIFPLRLGLKPKLASVWRICWHPSAKEPWSFDGQWLCLKMVNWRIRMAIKEDQNGNR